MGPLGGLLGGNNTNGTTGANGATATGTTGANAARAARGGAGFLTTPMIALMALHLVAFGIIVGGLTRGLAKKSRAPQLHASGLT